MKPGLKPILLFTAALTALGAVIVITGVVSIKASSGHWAPTRWFLNFAKHRSVALYSSGIKAPNDLNDPDRILLGAGAYQTNCAFCHGSPGERAPVVAKAMTPTPPYLASHVAEYSDAELFQIVNHGIKLTGMPAWPARHRDEEVWAVVAFLRTLPGLDSAAYHDLVWGGALEDADSAATNSDAGVRPQVWADCFRCHGSDGSGRGDDAFPRLSSQSQGYLSNALKAYASGERPSGVMGPVAAGLDQAQINALARYFARQSGATKAPATADADSISRGEKIATQGDPRRMIASCVDCHDPDGVERKDAYPILYGQPASYLRQQLELFKSGHRGGSEFAHLMDPITRRLTPAQIADVAAYFAHQPPPQPASQNSPNP